MEYQAVRVGWIYRPTTSEIIENGLLVWNSEKISYIGPFDKSKVPRATTVYEFPKGIMIPPFVNGHTHIPESLLRGLVEDEPLETWLYDHIWKVEPQMNKDDARIGTELAIAEMVSTGTVAFNDQFYFADMIAEVVSETGMKAFLSPSIFDNNPETGSVENSYQQAQSVYNRWNGKDNRIKIGFGPHALYSVEEDLFKEIGLKARELDTMIHTHVLETKTERENALNVWDRSTISKLEEMELLDIILAAHVVHTDREDVKLLAKNHSTVIHNVQSNLKLGSGVMPYDIISNSQINTLVGTDGNASNNNLDMLEELRTVGLIHKGIHHDPKLANIETILKMATSNANKIFGSIYTGILENDNPCDFTIFDLDVIMGTPVINPVSNLLYSLPSTSCVMTVSNGQILYHEGNFPTLDIEKVKKDAQRSIDTMIDKADYHRFS